MTPVEQGHLMRQLIKDREMIEKSIQHLLKRIAIEDSADKQWLLAGYYQLLERIDYRESFLY